MAYKVSEQLALSSLGQLLVRFRHLLWPIAVGFLLSICVGFATVYFQQQAVQDRLKTDIALKTQQVAVPAAPDPRMQEYYQVVEKSIPVAIKAEDIISAVLNTASKSGFSVEQEDTIISVTAKPGVKKDKVGKTDYEILSFSIAGIEGEYRKVMSFITNLYSEPGLETLVLEKVNLAWAKESLVKVTIDFIVYRRLVKG
ncbi:MAG: hypothetical protein HY673_25450 [Chloroflexi bacterium]|nr:hypothetical protein [Chloroflexota bacterium]